MKYQYLVKDGKIVHKYEGDPRVYGGPWQYATRIESTIKNGKVSGSGDNTKIVKDA